MVLGTWQSKGTIYKKTTVRHPSIFARSLSERDLLEVLLVVLERPDDGRRIGLV